MDSAKDLELPTLPKPKARTYGGSYYTDQQMRDYAQAAVSRLLGQSVGDLRPTYEQLDAMYLAQCACADEWHGKYRDALDAIDVQRGVIREFLDAFGWASIKDVDLSAARILLKTPDVTSTEEDVRLRFEAWAGKHTPAEGLRRRMPSSPGNGYYSYYTDAQWTAWRAALNGTFIKARRERE